MSHSSNILRQLTANKYYWGNRVVIWCQNLIVSRMFDHFQVKHQQNVKLLLSQVFKWLKFGLFPFQSTGLCFEAFKTKRPFEWRITLLLYQKSFNPIQCSIWTQEIYTEMWNLTANSHFLFGILNYFFKLTRDEGVIPKKSDCFFFIFYFS